MPNLLLNFICVLPLFYSCTMKNNLRSHLDAWKNIGSCDTVLNWIKSGIKFPLTREVESFEIKNKVFTKSEETFLETEISNLLLLGCIDIAPLKPKCVSPIMAS